MNRLHYSRGIKNLAAITAICLVAGSTSFADIKSTSNTWDKTVLSKNKGYTIEKKIVGDVSGDGKNDTVYVLGQKIDSKSIFFDHFRIAVVDSSKGKLVQTTLPQEIDGGYGANLVLSNIQGSKANELIMTSPTGGSGGFTNFAVYAYDGKALKSLLNSETSMKMTEVTGVYKDQYKVDLVLKSLNKTFNLDVRDRKPVYDELKMYSNAKLVKPEKPEYAAVPWGGGTVDVTLAKSSQAGLNHLVLHTVVKGTCNADSLAEVKITLHHNGKVFKPVSATLDQYYSEDVALLTKPVGEIKTLSVQQNGQTTTLNLKSTGVTTLLKSLYAVNSKPIFFPSELERQESDPTHTLVVTYKDGTKETLMTTETGEFVYRTIDQNGSWTGGVCHTLSTQINNAMAL